jgi:hypothetical protein
MNVRYDIETMTRELEVVLKLPVGCHGTIFAALWDAHRMGRERLSYAALKDRQDREREKDAELDKFCAMLL